MQPLDLKLTRLRLASRKSTTFHGGSPTTAPGYANPNKQTVIAATGAPSASRDRQTIYHLRCGVCGHDYGCNGLDIKARLCPACQSGVPGEALRELPPGLFD